MELEDLKELDKKEQERVSNITKKHEDDKKVDVNIFYKDFNLDEPYTSYNPISSVDLKPFQLAPFFKNVVLDIKPLSSEEDFKKYYGMDVERCYELKKDGLFKFRLSNNYIDYYNLDNDYLDLILHDKPPVSNVINRAHGILINKDDSSINDLFHLIGSNDFDFGNFIINDLGLSDPYMISAFDIMAGHSYDIKKIDKYTPQLYTYASALRQMPEFEGFKITESVIHFVKSDYKHVVPINEEVINQQVENLNKVASKIIDGEYPKKESNFCRYCKFRVIC